MRNCLLLIWFLTTGIACHADGVVVNDQHNAHVNKCTLVFSGIKEFPLDDSTSTITDYIQVIDADTATYFTFLNTYNNSIYCYDFSSASFLYRIPYQKEGPNGVGKIYGYCYVNDDSIFIYRNWAFLLYLTNAQAEVVEKNKLLEKSQLYNHHQQKEGIVIYPAPNLDTNSPLKKWKRTIILSGFLAGEPDYETPDNRPTGMLFNMDDTSVKYIVNYPEQYSKYHWGEGFGYRQPYYDLNEHSIIASFAADHYIVEYSLITGEQKRHYAGSAAIKEIKSFPAAKGDRIDMEKMMEWFMYNPSYQGIFYDKYKKRYYRMARLPIVEPHYTFMDKVYKPIIIIVLDENFKYIGEVALPVDKVFVPTGNCFVTEDGFHIQVQTGDEDKMTFCCYNFLIDEK